MNPIGKLFELRDKPFKSLNGGAYSSFLEDRQGGQRASALHMTTVYACVRILSKAVASPPLHVYRYNDTGRKEKALTHPLYTLLHDVPDPKSPPSPSGKPS